MNRNELKPDKKKIKDLRKLARLKQSALVNEFKNFKLKTSLRNYQRAEKGKSVSEKYLNTLAQFFDLYLNKYENYGKSISISDITKSKNAEEHKIEISQNQKGSKVKLNYINEECYLYEASLESFLSRTITSSDYRKIFYQVELLPNSPQAQAVASTIKDITQIHKESKTGPEKSESESYYQLDKELEAINNVSQFEENIRKLKKAGISLYAGNFQLNSIETIAMRDTAKIVPHPGLSSSGQTCIKASWGAGLGLKKYAIFCFSKPYQRSLKFIYKNYWHKEELKNIIKNTSFQADGYDWEADECLSNHLREKHNYDCSINKHHVTISPVDVGEIKYSEQDYTPGIDPAFDQSNACVGLVGFD